MTDPTTEKASAVRWPTKTREMQNHHMDSTIWNDFEFRDDDIVIASYAKSGTTWVQQIVSQLVSAGAEDVDLFSLSPWLDLRFPPKEVKFATLAAQSHRRMIKTHLPVDALVYSPRAKYIYVARDGRDVLWSLHNHHVNGNDLFYQMVNDTPGRVGPPLERPVDSIREYFSTWIARDGHPFWPFWDNVRSWWAIRELPNVLLLHYGALKADMPKEIQRIAAFLDIAIDEARWPVILEHCSFEHMKDNAAKTVPMVDAVFSGGAKAFINKGTNGRWRDTLTSGDCLRYHEISRQKLGQACADWLATGVADGDAPSARPEPFPSASTRAAVP